MAASPIPGLDVIEGYPIEAPKNVVPPPRPGYSAEGWANMRGQANPAGAVPGAPPGAGAARPAGFVSPGAPDVAPPAAAQSAGLRNPASAITTAGEKVGQLASSGIKAVGGGIKDLGQTVAKRALGNSNAILSGAAATAGHGNIYFDDQVPLTDKLRIGASDLTSAAGSAAGTLFGAGVGSVVPVAGTVAGGLAGGYYGLKGGHAAGNALFGSDDVLRRNGYDPEHGAAETIGDLIKGKSASEAFGMRAGTAKPVPNPPAGTPNATNTATQPAAIPTGAPQPTTTPTGAPQTVAVAGSPLSANGNVSNLRGSSGADLRAIDERTSQIRAESRGLQRELDAYGPGGAGAANAGSLGGESIAAKNAATDRSQLMDDIKRAANGRGRKGAALAAALASTINNQDSNQTQERVAGMRERGESSRAAASNATSMRGQDISAAGNQLNNETTRMGNQLTAKTAYAKAQYDAAKDNRDYLTGRSDHNDAQKTARETALQKNIEATSVNPDGTPNPAAAAEYRRGIDRSVAKMGASGVHELSPLDEQRLYAASDMLKTIKANASWLPFTPDQLKTIDPVDLTNLRVLPNGDRQITAKGQAFGQTIPGRFFQTEEGARMFGGTKTNKYDILQGQ